MNRLLFLLLYIGQSYIGQSQAQIIETDVGNAINDSVVITWYGEILIGLPIQIKKSKIISVTIVDCSNEYCQGATIYFDDQGFPAKEISKNTNSIYLEYKYNSRDQIIGKQIHVPSDTSLVFNYNYEKEIIYNGDHELITSRIIYSDSSHLNWSYKYSRSTDSLITRCQEFKKDSLSELYTYCRSRYVDVMYNTRKRNLLIQKDSIFEVTTNGDVKLPGGEELGGVQTLKYILDAENLIHKIQVINQNGVILKELNFIYKRT